MIGYLEGAVRTFRGGNAIVVAGGVGYTVAVTTDTAAKLRSGSAAALWTYLAVREDALDLYGFLAEEDLAFFELLLTVPGIGPKSALAILDVASVETLRSAIAGANATYLTTIGGIGKKTAEKIVLELKDKVGAAAAGAPGILRGDEDALEAMKALGYSAQEARDALRKVPSTIEKSNERLREALRMLGNR
jgi:Holliday junction DNA helicase RuvA